MLKVKVVIKICQWPWIQIPSVETYTDHELGIFMDGRGISSFYRGWKGVEWPGGHM